MGVDPFRAHSQARCDLGHRQQVRGVGAGRGGFLADKLEEAPRYRIDEVRMQPRRVVRANGRDIRTFIWAHARLPALAPEPSTGGRAATCPSAASGRSRRVRSGAAIWLHRAPGRFRQTWAESLRPAVSRASARDIGFVTATSCHLSVPPRGRRLRRPAERALLASRLVGTGPGGQSLHSDLPRSHRTSRRRKPRASRAWTSSVSLTSVERRRVSVPRHARARTSPVFGRPGVASLGNRQWRGGRGPHRPERAGCCWRSRDS